MCLNMCSGTPWDVAWIIRPIFTDEETKAQSGKVAWPHLTAGGTQWPESEARDLSGVRRGHRVLPDRRSFPGVSCPSEPSA